MAPRAAPEQCSVTMDTILQEVDTVNLLLIQGRGVGTRVGMGNLGEVVLLVLEHNPLQG